MEWKDYFNNVLKGVVGAIAVVTVLTAILSLVMSLYWIFIFCGNHSDSRKMWNPENRFRCGHRDSYDRGAFIFLADGAEYRNHMGNREY